MRRAGAAALLLAALAAAPGCLTLAALRPLPRACEGPLLPVAALGADFSLEARYRVRSGGREHALRLVAEKRGERLVLLGIDPLGTQLFALVQQGEELRRESHLRPLFRFPPENVLRDLERALFAEPLAGTDAGVTVRREEGTTILVRPSCDWEAELAVVGTREE